MYFVKHEYVTWCLYKHLNKIVHRLNYFKSWPTSSIEAFNYSTNWLRRKKGYQNKYFVLTKIRINRYATANITCQIEMRYGCMIYQ